MSLSDGVRMLTGGFVAQTGTFSGNSISATAALATLNELRKEGTYERLFASGRRLMDGLQKALDRAGVPAQVTGEPPALQPWFSEMPIRDFRSTMRADPGANMRFTELLLDRGIIKAHEKFFVSTAHGDDEIELTPAAFDEVAGAMAESSAS
jgi:glutamate-1-semialdehyde 2,1-aminomutase